MEKATQMKNADTLKLLYRGMATIGNLFPVAATVPHYVMGDAWNGVWQDFKQAGKDINYAIQMVGKPDER